MKYWMASYKLGEGKIIFLVNFCYYFVLILNVAIPIFVAIEYCFDFKDYPLSYQMLIALQVFSCFVLADGCRRFFVFIKKNVPTGINNCAVGKHLSVYLLYLIGLVYFDITYIMRYKEDSP